MRALPGVRLYAAVRVTPVVLHPAVVLRPGEQTCEVMTRGEVLVVEYAPPFAPRAAGLTAGHLVAIGDGLVLWRWFDAVVLDVSAEQVRLWEPAHGEVLARPRVSTTPYRVGGRAYASAGLPGAQWWVAGTADVPPEEADVELEEVRRFYTEHRLWDA